MNMERGRIVPGRQWNSRHFENARQLNLYMCRLWIKKGAQRGVAGTTCLLARMG